MKFILSAIILFAGFQPLLAQQHCGTVPYNDYLLEKKGLLHEKERYRARLRSEIESRMTGGTLDLATIYTIPVVFHCVYKVEQDSLSETDFRLALERLNEDFSNRHSDFLSVPPRFINDTGQMNIRFELAQQDPNGNPTKGILYHKTARDFNPPPNGSDDFMKSSATDGSDGWDAYNYLNVWVVNLGNRLYGYATFPENLPTATALDGVVINVNAFGVRIFNKYQVNYNRTLTHEVGHWMSLYHIWGDDPANNPCSLDDEVGDTPLQDGPSSGFHPPNYTPISCGNNPRGNMWMNFMDYSDDFNLLMFTRGQVIRARTALETSRDQIIATDKHLPAWHNRANFPVFQTNNFTGLAMGKNNNLWAGTNREGVYKFDGANWQISNGAPDAHRTNQMLADRNGGIWIAQQGTLAGGAYAAGGGLHYYPDGSVFTGRRYYGDSPEDGLPSRSARSLWIDTTYTGPQQPRVWVATMNQINPPNDDPSRGGIGLGLNGAAPFFSTITAGLNTSVINTGCYTVGGDGAAVYVFAPNNGGSNQILQYNAASGGLMNSFDHTNTNGALAADCFPRAIYTDIAINKWMGMESGGLAIRKSDGNWIGVGFPNLFPPGTQVNNNAITGDEKGQVFIGTSSGLVVFNGTDPTDETNYRRITGIENIPSDNVTALTIDSRLAKLVVGTDLGIAWLSKDCLFTPCIPDVPKVIYSLRNGNWNDPNTWKDGMVPDCKTIVLLYNNVNINDPNAECAEIYLSPGSNANILSKITITSGIECN